MQLTGIADRILVYVTLGYMVIATQFSQIAKKLSAQMAYVLDSMIPVCGKFDRGPTNQAELG